MGKLSAWFLMRCCWQSIAEEESGLDDSKGGSMLVDYLRKFYRMKENEVDIIELVRISSKKELINMLVRYRPDVLSDEFYTILDRTSEKEFTDGDSSLSFVVSRLKAEAMRRFAVRNVRVWSKEVYKIGADIEFEELNEYGRVVPSSYTGTAKDICIGCDGSGNQVEIRPKPGTAEQVVKSIEELIREIDVPISTRGDTFPLGGHVHFDFVRGHVESFKRMIDDFLGFMLYYSGRARREYFRRNSWRDQDWGYEYRSPSSRWCETPDVAYSFLLLAERLVACARKGFQYTYDAWNKQALLLDYQKVMGDKVFDLFRYFETTPPPLYINGNWKSDFKYRFRNVIFSTDSYDAECKNVIDAMLSELDTEIYVFGLRRERGDVIYLNYSKLKVGCDIVEIKTSNGCYKLLPPDAFSFSGLAIGLPYSLRVKREKVEELKEVLNTIRSILTGGNYVCNSNSRQQV